MSLPVNVAWWIRVEPDRNRFVVMVRGSEDRYCIRLQDWILNQVKVVCGSHYSTVLESTKEECIRSSHYSASEISLKEVLSDVARSEDERVLVCPETKLPIRAEKLLLRAGIAHSATPNSDSQSQSNGNGGVSWWNFGPSLLSSSSTTGERRGNGSGVKGTRQILHLLTKPLELSFFPKVNVPLLFL